MYTKKEVEKYITSPVNNGALLITGKWGCGKSYLIKQIINDFNNDNEGKYKIAIVSLFGVNDTGELNERIKSAYLEFHSVFLGSSARKITKALSRFAQEASSIAATATPESPVSSAISAGITSVVSFNPLNFISVKNTVGIGKKQKNFVLVVDDFERCNIPKELLLGAINEYTENRAIKTIIIADEDKIEDDKYIEFKEKLISRTLKMNPNCAEIIRSIILNFKESTPGYLNFLKSNLPIIQKVFIESKSENFRSLKSYIIDYERAFAAWNESTVRTEFQPKVFYMFGAMLFSTKLGTYKKGAYDFLFADTELQKVYSDYQGTYILGTLRKWITEGIWDKDAFIDEIKKNFKIEELSDHEKVLSYDFWDLDQDDITTGLPLVIEKAYAGELSRDELIGLLQKLHKFSEYSVPIPVEVDYSKIQSGFKKRTTDILTGTIVEPKRHKQSQKKEMDSEAGVIYDDICALDNKLITNENRQKFVDYLNNYLTSQNYTLRGLDIGAFDNELLNIFLSKYYVASNYQKRDLAQTLLGLRFQNRVFMGSSELQDTIRAFNKLKNDLQNQNQTLSDYITIAINNSFIKKIDTTIQEINCL